MSDYKDQWVRALELIKEVGIGRLGNFDGCLCSSFSIQGVEVNISCRKSGAADDHRGYILRVHSSVLYSPVKEIKDIAHEVAGQILVIDGHYPIKIRYADWAADGGRTKKCCWCGELREDAEAYLCNKHSDTPEALASYDFGPTEIVPPNVG